LYVEANETRRHQVSLPALQGLQLPRSDTHKGACDLVDLTRLREMGIPLSVGLSSRLVKPQDRSRYSAILYLNLEQSLGVLEEHLIACPECRVLTVQCI
jgi:hypothetical protein